MVTLLWLVAIPSLPPSPWFERTKSREIKTRAERTIVRVDRLIPSHSTHFQGPGILPPNEEHVLRSVLLPQKSQQPILSQIQVTKAGVQTGAVNGRTNKEHQPGSVGTRAPIKAL